MYGKIIQFLWFDQKQISQRERDKNSQPRLDGSRIALGLTFDLNMKSYRLLLNNRSKNLYELNILTQEPAL